MSEFADAGQGGQLWRNVMERLACEIAAGVFRPGERLANERALAERYAVHRHTLRRAVAELANRGLLDVRHGRGTFVQPAPIAYRVGAQSRFRRNVAELNREPGGRLLTSASLPAPAAVAARLGLVPGADTVRLDILREVDGVPLIRSEHWFPADRFPAIAARFAESQSITSALEALGVRGLRRQDSSIATRLPTRAEAAALRQAPTMPVLVWESLKVDGDGTPLDFGVALVAGERVQLVFELTKP